MAEKSKGNQIASTNVKSEAVIVTGRIVRTARLKEEWYEDIEDPASFIRQLKISNPEADIFTFHQRIPQTQPMHSYYYEWESLAVLSVETYDEWLKKKVYPTTRNKIRKAEKKGAQIRLAAFDDEFVKGMINIFNETPVRQGKPFWHYKKDFDTVRKEFSRNLHREDIIAAYSNDELLGFIMLAYTDRYAMITQIISMIKHRDKAPNNALLAEVVRICDQKRIPYLLYAMWVSGALGEFKQSNGFEKMDLPRYYIPLTIKGKIALWLKLHHGYKGILPDKILKFLIDARGWWYKKRKTTTGK